MSLSAPAPATPGRARRRPATSSCRSSCGRRQIPLPRQRVPPFPACPASTFRSASPGGYGHGSGHDPVPRGAPSAATGRRLPTRPDPHDPCGLWRGAVHPCGSILQPAWRPLGRPCPSQPPSRRPDARAGHCSAHPLPVPVPGCSAAALAGRVWRSMALPSVVLSDRIDGPERPAPQGLWYGVLAEHGCGRVVHDRGQHGDDPRCGGGDGCTRRAGSVPLYRSGQTTGAIGDCFWRRSPARGTLGRSEGGRAAGSPGPACARKGASPWMPEPRSPRPGPGWSTSARACAPPWSERPPRTWLGGRTPRATVPATLWCTCAATSANCSSPASAAARTSASGTRNSTSRVRGPRGARAAEADAALGAVDAFLAAVEPARLAEPLEIRGKRVKLLEMLVRTVAHTSEHVGQIMYIAMARQGERFASLVLPRTPRP